MNASSTTQIDTAQRIRKAAGDTGVPPNLADYETAIRSFTWEAARAELNGLPGTWPIYQVIAEKTGGGTS